MKEYGIDPEESVSYAVTTGVSAFEDTPVADLPALYDSIDPAALNRMFRDGGNCQVSFSYSNSLVVIYSGEYLTLETQKLSSPDKVVIGTEE